MNVQMCEGIWETGIGQRLVITRNPRPLHGKNWTDGLKVYSDDGVWESGGGRHNLVKYLGPLPDSLIFFGGKNGQSNR